MHQSCLAALLLLLCSCHAAPPPVPSLPPVSPPVRPPLPPKLAHPLLAQAALAPKPPLTQILGLPAWRLPDGWATNHWRVMRSTNLSDWQPVCAWTVGRPPSLALPWGQPQFFLRLESYVPPPPPIHLVDPNLSDEE